MWEIGKSDKKSATDKDRIEEFGLSLAIFFKNKKRNPFSVTFRGVKKKKKTTTT